ncbi:hypothetical protein A2291_02945 [candidate division WOR-1 bacterium RIFOXYB2_FULL_42_35]|uniref:Response regulatory domain-containing protein n=1 Tax=candidate division WOR-1 bacterium RIFOXYC2_FULL_41_25 TaxID=1802586 RepID=A0A1F4TR16_UNCSA|nr:MAG: hypothetical protein A2247_01255 [candidate division WOR-1 bacterium RIFOXYA2_FULL_41_14]OGC25706.1 MAG: hypothetical protein A2291_02945 [candidate division WOR-1 bacterium RIFOXYB2_FULL_42_35]OGC35108.1 MAG: hypothetical protein A2462_06090 [candidate division WOR-1 bacterium RIFOXYC2_FULL_41_25]OGC43956.1 MAG: hypothetical protein A2548_05405 [candidate division WOR-1 bacterium RIFOXYD2_FULL_41_8]
MNDKQLNILLVEDTPEYAKIAKYMLDKLPEEHSLLHAWDLATALKIIEENRLDVILLDLNLSDSKGIDTAQKVLSKCGTTPIIILTIKEENDLALKAISDGVQDYLVKGEYDSIILIRTIKHAIARKAPVELKPKN